MQIIRSIIARELFGQYPEIKKLLWGGHFWGDGGYIGTVSDNVTSDVIRKYIDEQGAKEEHQNFDQLRLIDFN